MSIAVDMGCAGCWLTAEVLLALSSTIAHGPWLGATLLSHLHLGLVTLVVLGADGGQEVDEEAEHVPGVYEGNDPFEYSGDIPVIVQLGNTENDAETDLSDDEGKLDPEGDAEDRVLAVVDSQALVLPANEDGAHNVPNDEDAQADVVHPVVVVVVVDGQEDQTNCTHDRCDCTKQRVDLLPDRRVARKLAGVTQVALKDEGEVKCHNSDR